MGEKMNIIESDLTEISDRVVRGEIKAEEVVSQYLAHTQKINPQLNAFVAMNDKALEQAQALDKKRNAGKKLGRLAGVPVGIKDMLCTKGLRTTAGSKILQNFIPPYSATVVERLESADAITLGKTNQDEFAMGSSSETSALGQSMNPWDLTRVPGGSSGGSAAAVAARLVPLSIGTDTGGSIRQPASFCGVVGVKPTYGRVSRYGIVAFASSLDQAGPFGLSVRDCARSLEIISGKDMNDMTTSNLPVPEWEKNLNSDLKGMRVGLPKEFFSDAVSAETRKAVDKAIEIVRAKGGITVDIELPLTKYGVSVYYLVCTCEASSNLARYDGVRFGYRSDFSKGLPADIDEFYSRNRGEGFGTEVKRRIILGTYALSSGYYEAYYKKAGQVRRLLRDDYIKAFQKCDVIMGPVTTSPAFKIGERINNPLEMYLNDIFTVTASLAGLPCMSVPAGFTSNKLPIGVHIIGPHFEEQKMLNVAHAIEGEVNIRKEVPNVIR